MNFGSKYVYTYDSSEEEYVSDDEFEGGMDRRRSCTSSDDDDDEADSVTPASLGGLTVDSPTSSTKAKKDDDQAKRSSRSFVGGITSLFRKRSSKEASSSKSERERERSALKSKSKKKRKHHWHSRSPATAAHSAPVNPYANRMWRKADTNVIAVKFNQLKSPSNMHTGDPFHCHGCKAVLSKSSKLTPKEGGEKTWKCEFCSQENTVDLMDEEIPHTEDVTFMLQPAASTLSSGPSGSDQSIVIFCVDISGSMCVTTEVPGKMNLRGSHIDRLQHLNDTREPQYLPGQRRDVTFVSRLQAVQAAVDHQFEEISKQYPNRRCCLITFSTDVTVIGDGSQDALVLAGDKLSSKEELVKAAKDITAPGAIKDKRAELGTKLFDLEEGGMTALGPALLLSVAMASQVAGSKVIICTDGLANVGLGNLDELHSDNVYAENASFYTDVSDMASDSGVAVSVLSIAGTKCRLVELGKVAEATGGQVNIVDPLKLTQEFGSILADPIIATNVTATLQIHHGLYLRNEEAKESTVTKYIGNVTKSSEITFEYGVRKRGKKPTHKDAEYENVAPSKSSDEKAAKDNAENEAMEVEQESSAKDPETIPEEMEASPSKIARESGTGGKGAETVLDIATSNLAADSGPSTNIDMSSQPTSPPVERVGMSTPLDTVDSTEATGQPTSSTPSDETSTSSEQAPSTEKPTIQLKEKSIADTSGEKMDTSESAKETEGAKGDAPSTSGEVNESWKELKELPFQLQINYTDLEGAKILRVITQSKPITRERAQAEQNMNMAALGIHGAQTSARLALHGEYTGSRLNGFMYQRLLHRGRKMTRTEVSDNVYDNYLSHVSNMDHNLLQQQQAERTTRGRTYSDSEGDDDDEEADFAIAECEKQAYSRRPLAHASDSVVAAGVPRPPPAAPKLQMAMPKKSRSHGAAVGKKGVRRRMDLEDTSAQNLYSNMGLSSSMMVKKAQPAPPKPSTHLLTKTSHPVESDSDSD